MFEKLYYNYYLLEYATMWKEQVSNELAKVYPRERYVRMPNSPPLEQKISPDKITIKFL